MRIGRSLALAAIVGLALADVAAAQTTVGPSTTTEPYLVPTTEGVSTTSVLTTGDTIGGYRLVGIPDGLGAFFNNAIQPGTSFNVVAHHELGSAAGVTRSHGSKGALVSRWTIDRATLKVLSGRDQINSPSTLFLWNGSGYVPGTTAFERFCSADMAGVGAFASNSLGTAQRIFLGGEETSPSFSPDYGRAWAHIATGPNAGKTYQLPRLGRHSYENVVASPFAQKKTIVMIGDDAGTATNVTVANVCRTAGQTGCISPPSEVFMYVGAKLSTGNEIERAGLTNGKLYGLRVKANGAVVTGENKDFVFSSTAPAVTSARFELVDFGDVSNKTGVQVQDEAITAQVTQFIRVEDGAWDPRPGKQNDFYFVTTGNISTFATTWLPSRLWRLRFDDIANPEAGGTIEMLLTNAFYPGAATTPDDDPNYQMFDNMGIDGLGRIVLQEDAGGNNRLGRIYVYGIDTGQLVEVARSNAKFFGGSAATNPTFLTNNEEGSGVIDASAFLGAGWFLMSVQNHLASSDPQLVEGGQLLAMFIDASIARSPSR
jgi:hypothetical protein